MSCYTGLQGKMLKIWDADIVDAGQQAAEQIEKSPVRSDRID